MNFQSIFCIYLACLVYIVLPVASMSAEPSYGQLAQNEAPVQYQKIMELIGSLNSTTMPGDVQPLRKAVLYCRDMLDIFVYAFPNATTIGKKQKDVWSKLREDLNDGYTTLGDFQDLLKAGVDYTAKELKKRRDDCLDWQNDFQLNINKYNYAAYVQTASTNFLYFRDASELSEFYWEYVNVYPKLEFSGLTNIAMLEQGLLGQAVTNLNNVTSIKDIYSEESEAIVHDYRKLVRSILTVNDYFLVTQSSSCTDSAWATLQSIYSKFGKLNDEFVAYQFYLSNKDTKEAKQAKEAISRDWPITLSWVTSAAIPSQLSCLLHSIIARV